MSSLGLWSTDNALEREAIAIVAVVIGGTLLTGGAGGLIGTITGVLLIAVIENLINQVGTLRATSEVFLTSRDRWRWLSDHRSVVPGMAG